MSYKNIHPFQPGLRDLYVNHTTGDDESAGTISDPVATIQEAANRFKPLDRGVQTWTLNDDRTIHVQDPGGSSIFDEEVIIPPHAGDGALIIKADYQVEFNGLTEAVTTFSAITGFEVRQRLSFTTSPLTASTLGDGYFVIPETNTTGDPYSFTYEVLPIVDNATGTCDVTAFDPGIWTALTHGNGVTVDIVRPVVIWRPGPDASNAYPTSCIKNMGGALVVEGFRFQNSTAQTYNNIISNSGFVGETIYGTRVVLRGCIVEAGGFGGFLTMFSGEGVTAGGIIITSKGNYTLSSTDLSIINCRDVLPSGEGSRDVHHSRNVVLMGIDLDASNASGSGLSLASCFNMNYFMADIRGKGVYLYKTIGVDIWALSCESTGVAAGLLLSEMSSAYIVDDDRVVGSTGNTGYGIHLRGINSNLNTVYTGATLTGTLGDVKVGNNPVINWSATTETDMTLVCIFTSE